MKDFLIVATDGLCSVYVDPDPNQKLFASYDPDP
jgi:hypothetical protein